MHELLNWHMAVIMLVGTVIALVASKAIERPRTKKQKPKMELPPL
jgi:hypothetical protein